MKGKAEGISRRQLDKSKRFKVTKNEGSSDNIVRTT